MSRATDHLITDGNFWHDRCKMFEARIAEALEIADTCGNLVHVKAALNGEYSR